jgi:hypothetical protein
MPEVMKSVEKKEMLKELSRMMDRMDVMMSQMNDMKPWMKCESPCGMCKKREQMNEVPAKEDMPQPGPLKH